MLLAAPETCGQHRVPNAAVFLPSSPHYARDAFMAGLSLHGYEAFPCWPSDKDSVRAPEPTRGDLIVVWNRQSATKDVVDRYEAAGARVIVAENGYIGSKEKGDLFALARTQHNGAGWHYTGDHDRLTSLGVEIKPWRENGRHVLVLPQRSIGPEGVAMPRGWAEDVVSRLKRITDRPIRVRPHPGLNRYSVPLEPDLEDCWAAVTWGSGAGIKAIAAGIPVLHEFERWIGADAARFGIEDIEQPWIGDRSPMLHRLSWAQWRRSEIEAGEPFKWLLL